MKKYGKRSTFLKKIFKKKRKGYIAMNIGRGHFAKKNKVFLE